MFNCYINWAQILLRRTGNAPVILLSQEGFTQDDPLSMILYWISLVPLLGELRDEHPTHLYPFYADDAVFDGLVRRSAAQLQLLMAPGLDWGYFPETAKSLFIAENLEDEAAARQEFEQEGLKLNCVGGSRYLGA